MDEDGLLAQRMVSTDIPDDTNEVARDSRDVLDDSHTRRPKRRLTLQRRDISTERLYGHCVSILATGQSFGEIALQVIDDTRRTATCIAQGYAEILVVNKAGSHICICTFFTKYF